MGPELLSIVLRDNPWLRQPDRLSSWLASRTPSNLLPRLGVEAARRRWDEVDRIHLLVGPRQAGKSTLFWRHLAERDGKVLYFDCEQGPVQQACRSAPLFLDELESLTADPVCLFFDEVQHLEEAGLFFKGLADRRPGVPILVTGSSSYHLGARTRESLAGRATRHRLLPFSLAEVTQDSEALAPAVAEAERSSRFERHLIYGGFPAVWLSDQPEVILTDLLEAFVLRDASDLFQIQKPAAFRRLLALIAGQVGHVVNYTEWSGILGVHRQTVESYLHILESSHILGNLAPFAGGRRSELTSRPKVFFVDGGIRNRVLNDFRPIDQRIDRGAVLENWVYTEIWKRLPFEASVHFWRSTSGAEVDFVVAHGDELIAVEVKAGALRRAKLSRSARSFLQAYSPKTFLLVNTALEHEAEVEGVPVRWILPWQLARHLKFGTEAP